jgi:hypothetical protein
MVMENRGGVSRNEKFQTTEIANVFKVKALTKKSDHRNLSPYRRSTRFPFPCVETLVNMEERLRVLTRCAPHIA